MPQRITRILTAQELENKPLVKSYIDDSFRTRRTKKDNKLYINLCRIFKVYPSIIKQIIDNIPTLGYHKDYFDILMFSRDPKLDKYIYDIVIEKLRDDLEHIRFKRKVSTLGKWLPREGSKIDRKCHFVDRFNRVFFPAIEDKFAARAAYRRLKSTLNIEIGTIEVRLCTKTTDKIEYHKVAPHALKKSKRTLLVQDASKDNFKAYLLDQLKKMNLNDFVKEIVRGDNSPEMIEEAWSQNRFAQIYSLDKIMPDSICIIDLSKDIYETNSAYFAIGIALITSQCSRFEKSVIVGEEALELEGNIIERTAQIMRYAGPCEIDLESVCDKAPNLIVITPKEINARSFANVTHIKTTDDGICILPANRTAITKHLTPTDKNIVKRDIKFLTNNSHELFDKKSPVVFIFWAVLLLSVVQLLRPSFNII